MRGHGEALRQASGDLRSRSFDFSYQPSIKRKQIESMHEPDFIDRK